MTLNKILLLLACFLFWGVSYTAVPSFVCAQTTSLTNIAVKFSKNIISINAFGDFTSGDFTATAAAFDGGDAAIVNLTLNALFNDFTSTDLDIAAWLL
uniref:hypothetical protein n=1 Tax=Fulvivirga sp. TaxID=1931237 RepID=UPI004049B674